ncbi:MAG TPA: dynamin family protein [Pseudonocardiaceae bacterium]|nr:dynamin family protein [Pseudonocardiaceae bacterium]
MSGPVQVGGQRSLSVTVRGVLRRAVDVYRDQPQTAQWLRHQLDRLDEPLRVAIAGKVKAGKSTLLNALVGERIAPTDAGECTRVVTWYCDGPSPKIVMHPREGPLTPLPVNRQDGALIIDLQGTPTEALNRLVVHWPSQSLRTATLIDTPGIASMSTEISRRTLAFLTPEDDSPTEADAVIYLMRHLHATDAEFLESFRDQGVGRASSVNTIAVLSRADEIGGGRVDAMFSAKTIAQRYRKDPTLRGLCQGVVPVAGLLAQTGRTLRQAEFDALTELSRAPREEVDGLLLSTDRFLRADCAVSPTVAVPAIHPMEGSGGRSELLARFGLFGLRLSVTLIRQGTDTPSALAEELVRRSGLDELRQVLNTQFTERRDLLKARSALLALDSVLHGDSRADSGPLRGEVERILAGAHEFAELRLLSALRSGAIILPKAELDEAERLLGGSGGATEVRLGQPLGSGADELRQAALEALARWRRRAENPFSGRALADACRVVVRSCEGIVARRASDS